MKFAPFTTTRLIVTLSVSALVITPDNTDRVPTGIVPKFIVAGDDLICAAEGRQRVVKKKNRKRQEAMVLHCWVGRFTMLPHAPC